MCREAALLLCLEYDTYELRRHALNLASFLHPEPPWARYSFAVVAASLGYIVELWLDRLLADPVTPFLPAFAAVIASAAWVGPGPGLASTAICTAWCAVLLQATGQHSVPGIALRCLIFASEGLLLSVGSARLHRAKQAMARSEDWHRKLLDTSAEGIWVVNDNGIVTYANPRIAQMLGLTLEDLEGHNVEEFFLPQDLSMERIRFRSRRPEQKEQFDRRLRRRDGSELWVLTSANSLLEPTGDCSGVLSMMTDITERKRAEHALRRSEERFRSLFENILEGVYQSTPDGRILAANPMLLRMLGLTSEAQLNDVDIARDLYVDAGIRRRLIEQLERDGSFRNIEYELRRRTGGIITVQENARVVRDEEGTVLYYEGTLSDISERKLMEEQLRAALRQQLQA